MVSLSLYKTLAIVEEEESEDDFEELSPTSKRDYNRKRR